MESDDWNETRLREITRGFPYPPTPDLAPAVRRRLANVQTAGSQRSLAGSRVAWGLAAILLLFALLLSIPPVRAQILDFLQIGGVHIYPAVPTATSLPATQKTLPEMAATVAVSTPTPTPQVDALLNLSGETTLEEARKKVTFTVRLPASSQGLGPPDRVFLQQIGGPLLILVWLEPDDPSQVRLSLHQFYSNSMAAEKYQPQQIIQTTVNGKPGIWAVGPYLLRLQNGDYTLDRIVAGRTLIWEENGITYRLEGRDLTLDQAVKIAEALEP